MKNTMDALRNHLFATIEALQDTDNPMDIDRAKAVNQTAQTLINAAKVEVEFIEATGLEPAGNFFPSLAQENKTTGDGLNRLASRPSKALSASRG
jgi:hypothetical protein